MPEPPWFCSTVARTAFERAARAQHAFFTSTLKQATGGWMYTLGLVIAIPTLGRRNVRIVFTSQSSEDPAVFVSDGASSPHRYQDSSLCMWHPDDPVEQRWTHADGLPALLGLVQAHLLREAWWRETREWPGPEAPHAMAEEKGSST